MLDRKMDDTFLMGTTSSITVQSLGKIVRRAPAVGAKMWCVYRQDAAKRQTAGIVFTHRPKNQVFRAAGATRCTDSGQTL